MTNAPRAPARSWLDFWDAETAIYANARHKELHYAALARDISAHLPCASARVLDHGCGEALGAAELARGCGALLLLDAAPHVRRKLVQRFAGAERIRVLEDPALGEVEDGSLDLVVASSLIQYLSRAEFCALLERWRTKMKPVGALLLADIATPRSSPLADVLSLLAFGARSGFFGAALVSLARLYFSDYRRLRRGVGFARYEAAELIALLAQHGFDARRLAKNIGHNACRLAVIATPRRAPTGAGANFGDCAAEGLAVAVPSCAEMG